METRDGHHIHALSFDVEEHFQVSAFSSHLKRPQWDHMESRVERNTYRIAEILSSMDVKATFFILGWVAERHPKLVKHLAENGHELASHGYGHELVTRQTADQFRGDARKSKDILEQISGKRVFGYRAPSFSINETTRWALQILVEEGFVYDSSFNHRFKKQRASQHAMASCYQLDTLAGPIWEVSLSTMITLGIHVPVAGGGYFRLMPYELLRLFLKRLERNGAQLVMFLHPWEIDPSQPRMKGPWLSQMRHYMNLDKTELRLLSLLRDFRFSSIRDTMKPLRDVCAGRTSMDSCERLTALNAQRENPHRIETAHL